MLSPIDVVKTAGLLSLRLATNWHTPTRTRKKKGLRRPAVSQTVTIAIQQ